MHPTKQVKRYLYQIWFIGAAVWFFDALLSMHHRMLARGLVEAGIAAAFLATGIMFKRQRARDLSRRNPRHR
jgi:hypothetical protein